jgi:hypothetical protein
VGVWEFSTFLDGPRDYRELLAPTPLRDHRGDVFAALNSLRARPGGQTGLYDTTLAAYREAVDNWRPGRLNVVLIYTDGRDNDPQTIGLDDLISTLRRLTDPKRPVKLVYLGIGPDTDVAAMRRITSAIGGATFLSRDGADIEQLFFDGLAFLISGNAAR